MKKRILILACSLLALNCAQAVKTDRKIEKEAIGFLKKEAIARADKLLNEKPVTVTDSVCSRSHGGRHDFYSEADYFWPNPENPNGPYKNRDGMTYPGLFTAHRKAMIRFSQIIGSLASAYKVTGDEKYVKAAMSHLKAWFTDTATMMNPSLEYGQAIIGVSTGRGIGIIDTIHLMEVAQGILVMENAECFDRATLDAVKSWFTQYIHWLLTHKYGNDEMNTKNNHSTCWAMQVASFARLTGDEKTLDLCRKRFTEILLPNQMATDGSFPLELSRTKPYGYSIFNLDAMSMLCLILSDKTHDMFAFCTPDGKSLRKGIEYLYPFVADKSRWSLKPDVMYWDNWPVAQPFLLVGAIRFGNKEWFETWKKLDHYPVVGEVIRNLPVRNPVIWIN
jgi:hypothetical protein